MGRAGSLKIHATFWDKFHFVTKYPYALGSKHPQAGQTRPPHALELVMSKNG
jgi:hypothetical protein